ncbi:Uncharacterised protein [Porphyromonas macacae]|uniref:Uncharacterized protein n=1 Tax=Porphyromonas macacae TaxID=28115 RepID=A0A379E5Z0_9PORP|nr:Uncharacterised protein [Porphyromonas macacae]
MLLLPNLKALQLYKQSLEYPKYVSVIFYSPCFNIPRNLPIPDFSVDFCAGDRGCPIIPEMFPTGMFATKVIAPKDDTAGKET